MRETPLSGLDGGREVKKEEDSERENQSLQQELTRCGHTFVFGRKSLTPNRTLR